MYALHPHTLIPEYLIMETTLCPTNRSQLQIRSPGRLWMRENNAAQLHRRTTSPQFGRDLGARRTARIAWFRCARTPDRLYATGELTSASLRQQTADGGRQPPSTWNFTCWLLNFSCAFYYRMPESTKLNKRNKMAKAQKKTYTQESFKCLSVQE